MASPRYTLNIEPEDLVQEEPPQLTKKEKFINWLHYSKYGIMLVAFLLILAVWLVHDVRSRVLPDYQFALVTPVYVNGDMLASLESELEARLTDVNQDGHIRVHVAYYQLDYSRNREIANLDSTVQGNEETMAAEMGISTDLAVSESIIFITDNFEDLQDSVPIFALLDTPYYYPAEDEWDNYEEMYVRWGDSELMTGLNLPGEFVTETGESIAAQDFFADFQIAMRTLYDDTDEELVSRFVSCTKFMDRIRGIEEEE